MDLLTIAAGRVEAELRARGVQIVGTECGSPAVMAPAVSGPIDEVAGTVASVTAGTGVLRPTGFDGSTCGAENMPLLNFRDVSSSGASPLKPGRLFRSAQPFHLDDADLGLIRDARIRTIIDLREPHEQVPPDWSPVEARGVRVVRLPVADQILPSADEKAPPSAPPPVSASVPEGHRILTAFYRAIVDRAHVRLSEFATTVAEGGPILVHCAAGKDRTGTTVALLLDLIGTDHETIVADFVRTNDAMPDIMAQLTGMVRPEDRRDPATIPPGISDAPESAIRALLAQVTEMGGAGAVLGRHTDQATLDQVVATLTE